MRNLGLCTALDGQSMEVPGGRIQTILGNYYYLAKIIRTTAKKYVLQSATHADN